MSDSLRPHGLQHDRPPCPSLSLGVSCPLIWWCHPTISSSVTPFSSCLQSFPASGPFPMSWLFASSGQSIRASALASALPMNIQGWFPLGLTGLISLLSKGLFMENSKISNKWNCHVPTTQLLWLANFISSKPHLLPSSTLAYFEAGVINFICEGIRIYL